MQRTGTAQSARLKTTLSDFKEIKRAGEPSVFYLVQEATYSDALKILDKNGLRLLTYHEANALGSELIENKELEGKWFWLCGLGREEALLQKQAGIKDNAQLSFDVIRDECGFFGYGGGSYAPECVAPVIVGVKKDAVFKLPKRIVAKGLKLRNTQVNGINLKLYEMQVNLEEAHAKLDETQKGINFVRKQLRT